MNGLVQEVRYALRGLQKSTAFTVVAVLTLAVGIGAATAIFSVVNGVLLRPLPYPDQDRLVELVHEAPGIGVAEILASPAVYFGYRDHGNTFESVGLWDSDNSPATVIGDGEPESVQSLAVTHEILPMLGGVPIKGRGFTASDDLIASAPAAIVSYGYAQRHFGAVDPLEQTLVVNGVSRQVIGVLPQSFRFFDYAAELFYPLQPVRAGAAFPSGDGRGIARLKPGVTLAEANADVTRMIPLLVEEFSGPGTRAVVERARFAPKLRWLKDSVVGDLSETLWLLMGTIGVLLLIACANVANLVLVRTQAQRPVLAVRVALGAGTSQVARVIFAESALIAFMGATTGVALAYVTLPLLLVLGGNELPDIMKVGIDPIVLLVAVGMSVFATIAFAILPLIQFALPGFQAVDALRGRARSMTDARDRSRARQLLLVMQVAMSLVLLVGSGLMIRTFVALRQVDPGFQDGAAVQTFQVTIPAAIVPHAELAGRHDPEQTLRMQHEIVNQLASIAGVASAAFSSSNDGLPLDGDGRNGAVFIEGKSIVEGVTSLREIQSVSPEFFETLRTPLVVGRAFEWNDVLQRRPVVQVSENLARAEWGSPSAALGRRIAMNQNGPWSEIIGVVQDVRHYGLNQPAPETVIFPASARNTVASFVVRSERVGTTGFLNDLQRAVWAVNRNLSLSSVQTLDDLYERSLARTTLTLRLLTITGAIALVLALVGIYGMVGHDASQRRREIGVRLALGAEQGRVRWMFVRHAMVLVAVGVAVGLVGSTWLTRLMESQLFGIDRLDPIALISVSVVLMATALMASYVPSVRAARVDPLVALRDE